MPLSVEPAPGPALSTTDRDRLLAADPSAGFFHTAAWTDTLVDAWPYYRLEWLLAHDGNDAPVGALPVVSARRFGVVQLFSLPYGTYGGPLADGADESARATIRAALVGAFRRRARAAGVGRAELVVAPGSPALAALGDVPAAALRPMETHRVDLAAGFDTLWTSVVDGDVRTSCRKAERSGVTVRSGREPGDVALVERLYRDQAAGWRNHTPFPDGFFPTLARHAGEALEIWTAEREGVPLAAQLLFHWRDTTTSWLAPNTAEAREWNAPTLLYVRIMEALASRGVRTFDLGGSAGNPKLADFKAGLGGRAVAGAALRLEAGWFRPLHRLQYRLRGIEE